MNTEQLEKPEVILIQEEVDGSATVDLPESIPSPEAKDGESAEDGSDEADERARRTEMADGGEVDPGAERLREANRSKRKRRKDYHKQVEIQKDLKLDHLGRQNQELLERLAVLERKSHGTDIARVNQAIEDESNRIAFAKQKMNEAIASGNGELHSSAQEMWFESRRNHESLINLKQKVTAPQRQRTIAAPDPQLTRHASAWMAENSWYDPNGKDSDSRRALNEDQILADEGFDPRTEDYWVELDKRLHKMMPHRYNDAIDDKSFRQSRPRNVVTGSNRDSASNSGRGNTFTLNPGQVRAMKDAGMWDDPDKRARMVRRYALEARNNQS